MRLVDRGAQVLSAPLSAVILWFSGWLKRKAGDHNVLDVFDLIMGCIRYGGFFAMDSIAT